MNFVPCNNFPSDPEHIHILGKPCPKCGGAAGAQRTAPPPAAASPGIAPVHHPAMPVQTRGASSVIFSVTSFLFKVVCALAVWTMATFNWFMAHVSRFSASRSNMWEKVAIWAAAITFCMLVFGLMGWAVVESISWLGHMAATIWQDTTAWLDYKWNLFTYRVEMAVDRFTQWLFALLNSLLQLVFTIALWGFGGFAVLKILKNLTSK